MVYDPIRNHFAVQIAARFYDITGEITEEFEFMPWEVYDDTTHKQRLIRQCVNYQE